MNEYFNPHCEPPWDMDDIIKKMEGDYIGSKRSRSAPLCRHRNPAGRADGFKHSLGSLTECRRLMANIPDDAPAKRSTKCIVKVDPNAKPLPPMS